MRIDGLLQRAWAIIEALRLTGVDPAAPLVGAELGVAGGVVSEGLLRMMPQLYLYMIDRWRPAEMESVQWVMAEPDAQSSLAQQRKRCQVATKRTSRYKRRRKLVRGDSVEVAAGWAEPLDFVYIDAGHGLADVLADIQAWSPHIRPGGVIGGHDIDHPLTNPSAKHWAVREAVEHHLRMYTKPRPTLLLGPDTTWFYQVGPPNCYAELPP